jgi:hypothetical protein
MTTDLETRWHVSVQTTSAPGTSAASSGRISTWVNQYDRSLPAAPVFAGELNKHHGDLRLESTPGDTRFQVRLPFVAPERVDLPTEVYLDLET